MCILGSLGYYLEANPERCTLGFGVQDMHTLTLRESPCYLKIHRISRCRMHEREKELSGDVGAGKEGNSSGLITASETLCLKPVHPFSLQIQVYKQYLHCALKSVKKILHWAIWILRVSAKHHREVFPTCSSDGLEDWDRIGLRRHMVTTTGVL